MGGCVGIVCFLGLLLFGCVTEATVQLQVYSSSSIWFLAVLPENDGGLTTQVQLKDGSLSSFVTMTPNPGWGYYSYSSVSGRGFVFPVTINLISASGATISTQLNSIVPGATIDTGLNYATGSASSAVAATSSSAVASSSAAVSASTSGSVSGSGSSTGSATTSAGSTTGSNLCTVTPTSQEPLKLLLPLYVYPGSSWNTVASAASQVNIIAIINPDNGPVAPISSSYSTYMQTLHQAGVQMIGYVYTSYATRSLSAVQTDVNTWYSNYPYISGIFFDEADNTASSLPYYTTLYNYVLSKGYTQVILNPGLQPDQGYLNISTSIVVFEGYGSSYPSTTFSSWVTCAPTQAQKANYKYHFTSIVNNAASSTVSSILSSMSTRGMGLVYVTDGLDYNSLASYFTTEISNIASIN